MGILSGSDPLGSGPTGPGCGFSVMPTQSLFKVTCGSGSRNQSSMVEKSSLLVQLIDKHLQGVLIIIRIE